MEQKMPKMTTKKKGKLVSATGDPKGEGGEVGGSGEEGEGKSQKPRACNEGENEQVPEGESEGGITVGVGVQTRSRASSSNPKKYCCTNSGAKRKWDPVDVKEEANQDSEEKSQNTRASNNKEDPVNVEEAKQPSEVENPKRPKHLTRKRTRWFPRGNPMTWTITKKKKAQIHQARKPLPRKVIVDLAQRTRPRYGQPARKAIMSKIVHRGDVAQEGRRPRPVVMTTWMGA